MERKELENVLELYSKELFKHWFIQWYNSNNDETLPHTFAAIEASNFCSIIAKGGAFIHFDSVNEFSIDGLIDHLFDSADFRALHILDVVNNINSYIVFRTSLFLMS